MPAHDPNIILSRGEESVVFGTEDSTPGFLLVRGVEGLGIAPTESEMTAIPSGHGSVLRSHRLTDRDVFLPIRVEADSWDECHRLRDELYRWLNPAKGPLRLAVQSKTGNRDVRWVEAVYASGMEGNFGEDFGGKWMKVGLTFKVPSAFWSQDEVSRLFQISPGMKPFISTSSAFFPITLYSSSIAGVFPVEVRGDQPVWPTITVTGPGTDLTIQAGGKRIKFEGDIQAGRRITFDTANGDVYDATNTTGQLWNRVSLDTQFFQLQPGSNDVKVVFTGANTESLLEISYEPQWLAGY